MDSDLADNASVEVATVLEIAGDWFGPASAHRVESAFDLLVMDLGGDRHGTPPFLWRAARGPGLGVSRAAPRRPAPRAKPAPYPACMAYTNAEARQELLDIVAEAIDQLGGALAALGEAYEQLDEHHADELEARLFRPVQVAYGRAKRTHGAFATRHALPARAFEAASPGAPSTGAKGFVSDAVQAVAAADTILSTLQDSMLPVEVGDPELRAGLSEVRELIGDLPARAREVVRTLGR
jgi:hypothetical protein